MMQSVAVAEADGSKQQRTTKYPSWYAVGYRVSLLTLLLVFGSMCPSFCKSSPGVDGLEQCDIPVCMPECIWNTQTKSKHHVILLDGITEYLVPIELLQIHSITSSTNVSNFTSAMFKSLRSNWKLCLDINLRVNFALDRTAIWTIHEIITEGGSISDNDFERLIRQMGGPPNFCNRMWVQIKHFFGSSSTQEYEANSCSKNSPATRAYVVAPEHVAEMRGLLGVIRELQARNKSIVTENNKLKGHIGEQLLELKASKVSKSHLEWKLKRATRQLSVCMESNGIDIIKDGLKRDRQKLDAEKREYEKEAVKMKKRTKHTLNP